MTRKMVKDELLEEKSENVIRLLLFVDDQKESNRAVKIMEKSGLKFKIWKTNGEEVDYWVPPVLYAPEGIFESLRNIISFTQMRAANGGKCILSSYAK